MFVRKPDFEVRFSKVGDRRGFRWKVVGYPEKGHRKIFWFADKKDAVREAEALNIQLKKFGPEVAALSIHQKLDAYRGFQILAGAATLSEASSFYIEQKRLNLPSKKLSEVVEECIEVNKRRCARKELSISQVESLQKGSRRLLKEFGNRDISGIKKPELIKWLDRMDVSSTSKDFYRRYCVTYFSFAVQREYLRDNPAKGIPPSGMRGDISILSVPQCKALLFAASPYVLPYYLFCLFAGLRPLSEVKRMSWDAIDWDDNLVKVENHKLGKKTRSARYRYVAMSQNLRAWLQPYREWVGPVWPETCWESMHKEARIKAGVYASWGHDILRHTFASYLFALKQDSAYTASQMGHESATMIFRHYRRLVKPEEAIQFWNIFPRESLENKTPDT